MRSFISGLWLFSAYPLVSADICWLTDVIRVECYTCSFYLEYWRKVGRGKERVKECLSYPRTIFKVICEWWNLSRNILIGLVLFVFRWLKAGFVAVESVEGRPRWTVAHADESIEKVGWWRLLVSCSNVIGLHAPGATRPDAMPPIADPIGADHQTTVEAAWLGITSRSPTFLVSIGRHHNIRWHHPKQFEHNCSV